MQDKEQTPNYNEIQTNSPKSLFVSTGTTNDQPDGKSPSPSLAGIINDQTTDVQPNSFAKSILKENQKGKGGMKEATK